MGLLSKTALVRRRFLLAALTAIPYFTTLHCFLFPANVKVPFRISPVRSTIESIDRKTFSTSSSSSSSSSKNSSLNKKTHYNIRQYSNSNSATYRNRRSAFRALQGTTRNLINGTKVGSWDRGLFEDASDVIGAWIKLKSRRSPIMAESLVKRIITEQEANNFPNADSSVNMNELYSAVIEGWANNNDEPGSIERAEEILDHLQYVSEEADLDSPSSISGPRLRDFNTILTAYANSGRPGAPQSALRVLGKMHEWYQAGRTSIAPDRASYTAILRAFAKQKTPETPEIVRKLIVHMEQLSSTYPPVKPDVHCHNEYLGALLDALNRGHLPGRAVARMADDYLHKMLSLPGVDVNTWSFNTVLVAWSRSGAFEMVERAEALIDELEAYHESTGRSKETQPAAYTYNSLIVCYGRSKLGDATERAHSVLRKMKAMAKTNSAVAPNTVSYNTVMHTYAKSGFKDAPLIVEDLLRELHKRHEETGDPFLRPNSRSFNTFLNAWAKANLPGSVERIKEWIEQMHVDYESGKSRIRPNKWAYSSYLQALSKRGGSSTADEAERVLAEMVEYQIKYPDLKPDVLIFTNVLHCVAVSGHDQALERANAILKTMEEGSDVRPNLFTYNCVINAAAQSKRLNKSKTALQTLRRMQAVALRPGTASFNNVITACMSSDHPEDDKEACLQIALDVLREAQDGPGADWITYQSVLKVIRKFNSNKEDSLRLIRDVLHQCCKDKQITFGVLRQVKEAVSSSEYDLLTNEMVDIKTGRLREKYTLNARRKKMLPLSKAVVI